MKKKIKYYSRKATRLILAIIFPVMIITLITLSKYKPVYSVKFRGENIGLVSSKEELDSKIETMIESPQAPVKEAKLEEKPEYSLKLADRGKIETEEKSVIDNIQDNIEKNYEIYEIKVKDKVVGTVNTKKEANTLVNTLKEELDFKEITYQEKKLDEKEKNKIKEEKETKEDIKLAATAEIKGIKAEEEKKKEEEKTRLARLMVERNNAERRYFQMLSASRGSGNVESIRNLAIIHPLKSNACKISSPYGMRWGSFHTGVDFGAGSGAPPIYAAAAGKVIHAGWNNWGYGNLIKVDHGDGVVTYYAHLSSIGVSTGQMVEKGQFIGNVGSTGNSTGPHLHFEIRLNGTHLNPVPFLPYY